MCIVLPYISMRVKCGPMMCPKHKLVAWGDPGFMHETLTLQQCHMQSLYSAGLCSLVSFSFAGLQLCDDPVAILKARLQLLRADPEPLIVLYDVVHTPAK